MNMKIAEQPGEALVLVRRQRLVPEEDDQVLREGPVQLVELPV
jgi:hypothetical protein